jgi:hypothetical protein
MAIPTRFVTYFFDDLTIRDQGDMKRIRDAATQQLGALQPGDRAASPRDHQSQEMGRRAT